MHPTIHTPRIWPASMVSLLLVGMTVVRAFEPPPPSCVLLPLEAGAGVTEETAVDLTQRVGDALRQAELHLAMKPAEAAKRLKKDGVSAKPSGKSPGAAAVLAGRQLGVDYVFFGTVEQRGTRSILDVSMIDVARMRYVNRVQTFMDDDFEGFRTLAPATNVKALLAKWTTRPRPQPEAVRPVTAPTQDVVEKPSEVEDHEVWGEITNYLREFDTHIEDHLQVGTRCTFYRLLKRHRRHFLGTIETLDEKQSALPAKLFVAWCFNPEWAVNLTWDRIEVETITSNLGTTDGQMELTGLYLSGVRHFPNQTPFTPYASAGLALFKGHFQPSRWWALGYNTMDDWNELGSPRTANSGITQSISVGNALGIELAGGCDYQFAERWAADLLVRYTWVRSDTHHRVYRNGQTLHANSDYSTIPFSHLSLGVGVRYAF